jgi:hypothetical protein
MREIDINILAYSLQYLARGRHLETLPTVVWLSVRNLVNTHPLACVL